ncbi:uncharacterized protein LOC124454786 [Xenia sp. Carnegie-2017]|uniref:uncharacterized protein LOC124454786 n=1 Tax=Xenia sp. Carnegie-2017 TaxID=2897299 RepID=UPI001F03EDD1|nr:uncharacterized protein LOC124454786 [Xenia sp. Carnegie-2017]
MYFLFLVAMLVQISLQIEVSTKDCGSKYASFSNLQINCEEGSTTDVCNVKQGKTYASTLNLTPNTIIENATIVLHGVLGGMSLPLQLEHKHLCEHHGVVCPLKPGVQVIVKSELAVPGWAMGEPLVKTELKTKHKNIICMTFKTRVE